MLLNGLNNAVDPHLKAIKLVSARIDPARTRLQRCETVIGVELNSVNLIDYEKVIDNVDRLTI